MPTMVPGGMAYPSTTNEPSYEGFWLTPEGADKRRSHAEGLVDDEAEVFAPGQQRAHLDGVAGLEGHTNVEKMAL